MTKNLYFCVTNDLVYDQRMIRICGTLQSAGYKITLVGRKSRRPATILAPQPYRQKRLNAWFSKGKAMYLEFNFRLLFYLLFHRMDMIIAIDLDTILPCYAISVLKGIPRAYDAHEWFSELKEVVTRPAIHRLWLRVEKNMVPRFPLGYTVSQSIADAFRKLYGVDYRCIYNAPPLETIEMPKPHEKYLLYQGAVNEGRGLEWLIPAMKLVNAPLWIAGEGNFSSACRELIRKQGMESKVKLLGRITPGELRKLTCGAYAGVNLVEPTGMNQVYSLANKFFDYIHAGIPQVTMKFPEYVRVNREFEVARLLDELNPAIIAQELNNLLENEVLYQRLRKNCRPASLAYNWNTESVKLLQFYHQIFP